MTGGSDSGERDLAAVAAALLAEGRRVDGLSRPLTVVALAGCVLAAAFVGRPPLLLSASLGLAAVCGLAELYLAIRVGFDAVLFERLAAATDGLDLTGLDRALSLLGLVPPGKTGRPMAERIAGARRLLGWQGRLLGAQALLLLAAGFAV